MAASGGGSAADREGTREGLSEEEAWVVETARLVLGLLKREWFGGKFGGDAMYMAPLLLSAYLAAQAGKPLSKKASLQAMGAEDAKTGRKYVSIAEEQGLLRAERGVQDRRQELLWPTDLLQRLLEEELMPVRLEMLEKLAGTKPSVPSGAEAGPTLHVEQETFKSLEEKAKHRKVLKEVREKLSREYPWWPVGGHRLEDMLGGLYGEKLRAHIGTIASLNPGLFKSDAELQRLVELVQEESRLDRAVHPRQHLRSLFPEKIDLVGLDTEEKGGVRRPKEGSGSK